MSLTQWLLLTGGFLLVAYAGLVAALMVAGRGAAARALAGFIPDCIVLARRLMSDPRMPRRHKVMLGALIVYLALPFDLVPDFIPIAGQLDDAVIAALVLRAVLRAGGPDPIREHWPGPDRSLNVLLRIAGRRADEHRVHPEPGDDDR